MKSSRIFYQVDFEVADYLYEGDINPLDGLINDWGGINLCLNYDGRRNIYQGALFNSLEKAEGFEKAVIDDGFAHGTKVTPLTNLRADRAN